MTEKREKGLEEVKQQRKIVDKLKKFKDSLNNDNNNILNNLCTGLEKFLGFNSASKGYTGEGIVYSDLDRLCDAVMGFLLSCLEGSKDLLTHYYPEITETIAHLKSSIGKGLGVSGFASAIGKVRSGLQGYEDRLGQLTSDVVGVDSDKIGKLKTLEKQIDFNINQVTELEYEGTFEVNVTKWFPTVTLQFNEKLNDLKSAVMALDPGLRSLLINDFLKIKLQINNLEKAAQRDEDELSKLGSMVSEQLMSLETQVTKKALALQNNCMKELKAEFNKIVHWPLRHVEIKLQDVFDKLHKWLATTRDLLRKAAAASETVHTDLDPDKGGKQIKLKIDDLNKSHEKGKKGSAESNSIEYVLDNGVEGALSGATKLVDTKLASSDIGSSAFHSLEKSAADINTQARGVHTEISRLVSAVIEKLGNISKSITDPDSLINDSHPAETFGQKIEELEQVLDTTSIKETLDKMDDLMVRNYCGRDNFKKAFEDHINRVREQIKGIREIKKSVMSEDPSKIKERSLLAIGTIKQSFTNAVSEFQKKTSQLKLSSRPYSAAERDANAAMQSLDEISKSVGEANTKMLEMFKATQDEIKKAVNYIWVKGSTGVSDSGEMKAVRDQLNQLNEEVITALGSTKEGDGSSLREELEKSRKELHDLANNIKGKLETEIKNKLTVIQTAISSSVAAITDQLRTLRTTLDRDVTKKINELRTAGLSEEDKSWEKTQGLGKILDDINNILNTDEAGNLNSIVPACDTFSEKTIKEKLKSCVTQIINTVEAQVTEKIENINYDALRRYVASTTGDMKKLKAFVAEMRQVMFSKIKSDRENGLKGFLKTICGVAADAPIPAGSTKLDDLKSLETVVVMSPRLKIYVDPILDYLYDQVTDETKTLTSPSPTDLTNDPVNKLTKIKEDFDKLLTHLSDSNKSKKYNYDHPFTEKLATLKDATNDLSPAHFANPRHPELLDAVRKGMEGFVEQMGRVYVNGYDTRTWNDNCQNNYAKIFFTIFNIIFEDLSTLQEKCENNTKYGWADKKLSELHNGRENPLGKFMTRCGFKIAEDENAKTGELNFPLRNYTGQKMLGPFGMNFTSTSHVLSFRQVLDTLLKNVDTYNSVCHIVLRPKSRHPCNIYEMLVWLSGLTYNAVRTPMVVETISELFEKPEQKETDETEIPLLDSGNELLPAYPHVIKYNDIEQSLNKFCAKSYDLLTTILGTGDAYTVYAGEYCTNHFNLLYPADPSQCLDMLLDILRRLLPVLRFLRTQCKLSTTYGGWEQCEYGKDVKTTKWPCNNHSRDQVTDQPKCQPTCQANSKVNCQPNSPLMSYLNDCLPGHLPHHLTKIGCKYECTTCPSTSKKGMPCMTPLGFRGFSGSKRTGKEISDTVSEFLSNDYVKCLLSLVPKPPATLSEHFAFSLTLVNSICYASQIKIDKMDTFSSTFKNSITEASIALYSEPTQLTDAMQYAYRRKVDHENGEHPKYTEADLSTLSAKNPCIYAISDNINCARYLYNLFDDSYNFVINKHVGLYLSWAVYLPWKLHEYLRSLRDSFQQIICQDWGCSRCMKGDKCRRGQHGVDYNCQCRGIAECRGVWSTFYTYGFTFGNPETLSDTANKRYCHNFYLQLKNILNSESFVRLFTECDNFLFTIRFPFMTLTLSLWLLSLLYLLHIMVIRLDLLHIKSHLHSPSSHRIAAQSLLAAGRVNKLNRVFYLQP